MKVSGFGVFMAPPDPQGDLPEQPRDETAWLIEFFVGKGTPTYYGKTDEGLGQTTDHLAAIRFARKQDAQAVIDDIGWTEAQPIEHRWCGLANQ